MSEEKKLTDEEIVKALECCTKDGWCKECPYFINGIDCGNQRSENDYLDLINRQKAEIERLTQRLDYYNKSSDYHEGNQKELEERNAELQKQVDELKTENKELYKEHTTLIAGSILKQQDIVKDTAKEIYCHIAKAYYDKEMLKIFREYLKERYGVEVE